jgi:K+-sensing histidine kinase KdpD
MLAWWIRTLAERDAAAATAKVKAIRQEETFVSLRVANADALPAEPPTVSTDDTVQEILRSARRNPIAEICFGETSIRIWRGADRDTVCMLLQALKESSLC